MVVVVAIGLIAVVLLEVVLVVAVVVGAYICEVTFIKMNLKSKKHLAIYSV